MPASDPDYHFPRSVAELTEKNVKAIVDLDHSAAKKSSRADRIADLITQFCGSMAFVWVHAIWFAAWIVGNTELPGKPIDPYPFSFLTLVVSLEAIFLSTFLMIAANRKGRIDERRNHLDLQINLLSEQENTKMLKLLEQIAQKVGVDPCDDPEVSILEQATRPDELAAQIEKSVECAERVERDAKSS